MLKISLAFLFVFWGIGTSAQVRITTTIAGRSVVAGDSCGNHGEGGLAVEAVLRQNDDVCLDGAGNVYFTGANGVMRIDAMTGVMTRIAGGGAGLSGSDTIPATSSPFTAKGLCFDTAGRLLMATGGTVARLNMSTGYFTVVAGIWGPWGGGYTGDGGPATAARLESKSIAFDGMQNLLVLDDGMRY